MVIHSNGYGNINENKMKRKAERRWKKKSIRFAENYPKKRTCEN